MSLKLYEVHVESVYYALAESESDARGHAREAVTDCLIEDMAEVMEVEVSSDMTDDDRDRIRRRLASAGWDEKCLVYHDLPEPYLTDIKLGEAIDIVRRQESA